MAGVTTALALGASAIGGAMSASAQNKAMRQAADAAAFNPWGVSGGGGNITFQDGQIQGTLDPTQQMFQNMFTQQFQRSFGGGAYGSGAINLGSTIGREQLPGLFQGALDASMQTPQAAANMFSQNAANQALMGQNIGQSFLGMAQQFGGRQIGANEGQAQQLFGQGFGALGNTDFSQIADQQIAAARAYARPGEERAVDSKFQNLYNKGILSQTGGERQIGELALAQEQADIQRVMGAQQFANVLGEQNRAFGLNAINQGFGARQMDQSFNLGAGQLFGQMGQGMLNYGAGQAQSGLNAQFGLSDLINSRGQQRLANATSLLGLGSDLQNTNMNQAMGFFGGNLAMNDQLRQLMALGVNTGSAGAAAGAQQAQYLSQTGGSPMGSFLSGMGGGLMGGIADGGISGGKSIFSFFK